MTLSKELQQAAQGFGKSLRQHGMIQYYLQASAALNADPEARALDKRLESIRDDLVLRQHGGEDLPVDEVQAFYVLRSDTADNLLIERRDNMLTMAKGYLANVGLDLNQALGLDYVTMVLS